MKRGGLSVAVMVATVVMALTVSTYAITAPSKERLRFAMRSVLLGMITIIFRRH